MGVITTVDRSIPAPPPPLERVIVANRNDNYALMVKDRSDQLADSIVIDWVERSPGATSGLHRRPLSNGAKIHLTRDEARRFVAELTRLVEGV